MTIDKGYVTIDRTWTPGDVIALDLPMPVRRVVSNDKVIADRDRVALQRGPIVYAAEWPDNPNGKVRNIVLPDGNALTSEFRSDLLNGVQVIRGRATGLALDAKGGVTRKPSSRSWRFRMRPGRTAAAAKWRCGWRAPMRAARPTPFPTVVTTATIAASPIPNNGRGKNARNIIDGEEPANSSDSTAYFDWWPVQGSADGMGGADVREDRRRCRQRGLLVRRHRPRRRARARVVAAALQVRRSVAAGANHALRAPRAMPGTRSRSRRSRRPRFASSCRCSRDSRPASKSGQVK